MTLRQVISTAAVAGILASVPSTRAQQPALAHDLIMGTDEARAFLDAVRSGADHMAGELLVKFRDGTTAASRSRAVSLLRRVDAAASRWSGDVMLLRTAGEPDMKAAAALLGRQPEVEWAQPNHLLHVQSTPNDPSYARQWNFDLIGMPAAWDINTGGTPGMIIAVVDTGITTATNTFGFPLWTGTRFETVPVTVAPGPDIAAARVQAGRDFAFWTGPVIDFQGHGTHIAGTLLQETNNNFGAAGIAYRATLLPLKACISYWELQIILGLLGEPGFFTPGSGGCSAFAISQAIRFAADNGAKVINLSVGGETPMPIIQQAIQYAVERGVFVAIGAGNFFEFGNPIAYPAAYATDIQGAVAVGAVGRSQRRASYSSTGSHLELSAPGGDFDDGGIDGVIFQSGLFVPDFYPGPPFNIVRPRFDRYSDAPSQGTSMAAPHVAGAAALLLSQGITTPAAIEAALRRSATDLGVAGRDNEFGDGLINVRAALRGMGLAK
jgi:serine protease